MIAIGHLGKTTAAAAAAAAVVMVAALVESLSGSVEVSSLPIAVAYQTERDVACRLQPANIDI